MRDFPLSSGSKRPCSLLCKFTLVENINAGCWPRCYDGCSHPEHKQRTAVRVTLPRLLGYGAACKDVHVNP